MKGKQTTIDQNRETACAHMVEDIPITSPQALAKSVITSLEGKKFDCAETVFVVDRNGIVVGHFRIDELFQDEERRVADFMKPLRQAVKIHDDQERIASIALEHQLIAVPVVDDIGRLLGAVPPEALLSILRSEHMEDLQRMAGISRHRNGWLSDEATLFERYRRRLPWLVAGLLASSVVTLVMASFEHALSSNVAVAFFVPALVYVAGAIGAQAVSVAVRELSFGAVSIRHMMRDELLIGLGIGSSLGAISCVIVLVVLGSAELSIAVGLAVMAGGTMSSFIGFGLPWLFQKFGSDPALGSGPVCTVIQDATSLLIYFTLVTTLVR